MGENTMKYVKQFGIILLFSLAGDLCHRLLPFPIPASIYGMVLLLVCLALKWVKVEAVKETGTFLVSLLPLLFVVPTVGLMACWDLIREDILGIILVITLTTVLTFAVAGLLTKLLRKEDSHG
jgi:holin-like protein